MIFSYYYCHGEEVCICKKEISGPRIVNYFFVGVRSVNYFFFRVRSVNYLCFGVRGVNYFRFGVRSVNYFSLGVRNVNYLFCAHTGSLRTQTEVSEPKQNSLNLDTILLPSS